MVADYEFNNAYQYVIGREEHHLQWVRKAIEDLGATAEMSITALAVPAGKGKKREDAVLQDDVRHQQAFIDKQAFQCGFCTPGMIVGGVALLTQNPDASEEDIRRSLDGQTFH